MADDNNNSSELPFGWQPSQAIDAVGQVLNVIPGVPGVLGNIGYFGCGVLSGGFSITEVYEKLRQLHIDPRKLKSTYPALADYLQDTNNGPVDKAIDCAGNIAGFAAGTAIAGFPGGLIGGFAPSLLGVGSEVVSHDSALMTLQCIEKQKKCKTHEPMSDNEMALILLGMLSRKPRAQILESAQKLPNQANALYSVLTLSSNDNALRSKIPGLAMEFEGESTTPKPVVQQVRELVNRGMPIETVLQPARIARFAQQIQIADMQQQRPNSMNSVAEGVQDKLNSSTALTVQGIAKSLLAMGKTIVAAPDKSGELLVVDRDTGRTV